MVVLKSPAFPKSRLLGKEQQEEKGICQSQKIRCSFLYGGWEGKEGRRGEKGEEKEKDGRWNGFFCALVLYIRTESWSPTGTVSPWSQSWILVPGPYKLTLGKLPPPWLDGTMEAHGSRRGRWIKHRSGFHRGYDLATNGSRGAEHSSSTHMSLLTSVTALQLGLLRVGGNLRQCVLKQHMLTLWSSLVGLLWICGTCSHLMTQDMAHSVWSQSSPRTSRTDWFPWARGGQGIWILSG